MRSTISGTSTGEPAFSGEFTLKRNVYVLIGIYDELLL